MSEPTQKIHILYLTWGEVIVRSGIFRNQVVEQLILTRKSSDEFEVSLLSGIPLVNMKLLKSPRSFMKELSGFQDRLSKEGIPFSFRLLPAVSSWFYSKTWQFSWYQRFNTGYLRRYVTRKGIDLVHCRSYHATYFALKTKEKYGLNYKVIFDTRGLFPEEGVVKKAFATGDADFRNCKEIERFCLDKADAVVNVSGTFSTYIRTLTNNPNVYTIYTSTNLQLFRRDAVLGRETRASLGIPATEKVLVYLGDVRNSGWHQAANLARLYKAFSGVFPESSLLVVTEQDHAGLLANMSRLGVALDRVRIGSGPGQSYINALLNAADYGCLPFRDVENEIDRLLGYTMIASKTGEYLAVGLPVLSNRSVGAASALVSEEGLGGVYSDEAEAICFEDMSWAKEELVDEMKIRAVETARRLFDAGGNARKYGEIYKSLVCSHA